MSVEKIFSTSVHTRDEWLAMRRTGIGGSDAPTIVGCNNYNSLYRLYWDKMGALPDREDTEAMRTGRDLEDYVARRFVEDSGKTVKRDNFMYLNSAYPWALADIDRRVVGENAGLECKTTTAYDCADLANGIIPPYYYCQCMHYMAVLGFEKMYLAVLVLGRGFYWYCIDRDESEIDALMTAEKEFWEGHVVAQIPPETDGSDATLETIRTIYGTEASGSECTIDNNLFVQLASAQEITKKAKANEDSIKAQIMACMGENETGIGTDYKASWKSQSRTTLDSKRLRKDHQEIFDAYSTTSTSRTFRLSKIKKPA